MSYFNYNRRKSMTARIGNTTLGGEAPIRLQSMTNTSTMDTDACVFQSIQIIEAGGEYVRLTAQGEREAENLGIIRAQLRSKGYDTPLVADIHFNPKAAYAAAKVVEKVRINPGNFVDSARTFKQLTYTQEEYAAEIDKIEARFVPFLNICKEYGTAVRIGVNHGSLSDRIMSRYGDSPEGMVESCLEFLRMCRTQLFDDVVISIKASNTVIMVQTVRLLVNRMEAENMYYPLHLGVTEAGDGEDGRIKSAAGIGTLLQAGIGDTIRVSLSEAPEKEISVARKLVDYIVKRKEAPLIDARVALSYNPIFPVKRITRPVANIGSDFPPVVIGDIPFHRENMDFLPDFSLQSLPSASVDLMAHEVNDTECAQLSRLASEGAILLLRSSHSNWLGEMRAAFHCLLRNNCPIPVIVCKKYTEDDAELLQLKIGADFAPLLFDYFGEGICIENEGAVPSDDTLRYAFGVLQATRRRMTKTEFISCPGCGRTLFDLETTIARVKEATSHLKGLKIGIMGCIVNGPGEMADADYGYVGAGRGRISLYKGKECIQKNIPEAEAVERLILLIQEHGDWQVK